MTEQKPLPTIYTIGHSTHEFDQFVALLQQHGIAAVADVRSAPYSGWQPQFNREDLQSALKAEGIAYVFLGRELGARPEDPTCYGDDGKVKLRRLARTPLFQSGLQRVRDGAKRMKVALMCAEKEPLDCHRAGLIARELDSNGSGVVHILANGDVESHQSVMQQYCTKLGLMHDLFLSDEERLDIAYSKLEKSIAYKDKNPTQPAPEDDK